MTVAVNTRAGAVSADTVETLIRARPATAVAYVDLDHAIVAKTTVDGGVAVIDIPRRRPDDISFLVRIVDQIGDRERVVIVGPGELRLELEREYVSVYHRPDRLVDVEPARRETGGSLISRLAELSA